MNGQKKTVSAEKSCDIKASVSVQLFSVCSLDCEVSLFILFYLYLFINIFQHVLCKCEVNNYMINITHFTHITHICITLSFNPVKPCLYEQWMWGIKFC